MKILQTGITQRHTGRKKLRSPIEIWDESVLFNELMTDLGWDVDWRPGEPGEDVSKYDGVLVYLASPKGVSSRWAPGALWAMHDAVRKNVPLMLFFGDWDHYVIYSGFKSLTKGPEQFSRIVWGERFYWNDHAATDAAAPDLVEIATQFIKPGSRLWRKSVGFYAKMSKVGDPQCMLHPRRPMEPLKTFDPTAYVFAQYRPEMRSSAEGKERRWSMAALGDWREWIESLNLSWPVDIYGPPKWGGVRLPDENAVIEAYSKTWGILSPPHYNAGGGDFRMRTFISPFTLSILYGGPIDGAMLGKPFVFEPREIERWSDEDLFELACEQRDLAFSRFAMRKEDSQRSFLNLFELARSRAR